MARKTEDDASVDAWAKDKGAKQVGVIVHSPGINVDAWEDQEEGKGLHVVRCKDHSRLYKLPVQA